MYGDQDVATKMFGVEPGKGMFDDVSKKAESIFGA
jgi:hypothetical protein